MTIGDRIKSRRKHLGISAEELAKRIGKDRSTVFRYEKGDIENLPLDILEPIAKALGTTPQYLMGWDDDKKSHSKEYKLSEGEEALVELFRLVPEDQQKLVLQMIRAALGRTE